MALPINIEDLLRKQKIEGNRIEFKSGWNPDSIYHSICAFANDFDNIGGGYILVGVEEENGIAKRPVKGIPTEEIDGILKDMVGYNNKFNPYYMPRTSIEDIDGQSILVIWVPAGVNRPYDVRESVISKNNPKTQWYIRSGSSSIIAKGEVLDELRENGSAPARIETDDERSYFLLEIPCRDGFEMKSELKSELKSKPKSELKGELKTIRTILDLITEDPEITIVTLVTKSGKSRTTVQKCIRILKEGLCIKRDGAKNGGRWIVLM